MIISLTGFMGSGKSSVGRKLAELLGWKFMDLDKVIEGKEGRRIAEIFAEDGETEFRRMEAEALKMVINEYSSSTGGNVVLALGGGTVMTEECALEVHEHTICIYLRATADTLLSRLEGEAAGRPMLNRGDDALSPADALYERITTLMSLRSTTYENTAHVIIDTDGRTVDWIAEAIVQGMR